MWLSSMTPELYDIETKEVQTAVADWLEDRRDFHKWFTSIIVGSFVAITIFGEKPHTADISGILLTVALGLLLFATLCNLVCVWSIPGWKLGIKTGRTKNNYRMKLELDIPAWIGVIFFVTGLTLAFLGNLFAQVV